MAKSTVKGRPTTTGAQDDELPADLYDSMKVVGEELGRDTARPRLNDRCAQVIYGPGKEASRPLSFTAS
jgi:hypothetical protein